MGVQPFGGHGLSGTRPDGSYPLEWPVLEQSISANTAAAGGNASLMALA